MDYPHSLPDVYLHEGKFTDGTPDGAIPPSRDPAQTQNDVIDSILSVQVAGGLVAEEGNTDQLRDAIAVMIAAALAGVSVDLTGYAQLAAVQIWQRQQSCAVAVLADAATIAWDLDVGQMAEVTIAASRTLGAPTHQVAGTRYELTVIHGAANTTLSFAAPYKNVTALALSTAAGAVDVLVFRSTGLHMRLVGVALNVGA